MLTYQTRLKCISTRLECIRVATIAANGSWQTGYDAKGERIVSIEEPNAISRVRSRRWRLIH
ncbi:MAG: hypothetical protein ACTS42_02055 [Candidatus Hodgkinia cicadicola]